ncbi:MAG: peptide MFS transporter [Tissierellales bacterium]|jgi:POT family proton-dependent oligopeptide transporter|nr:peptide MFS transporter [Tissierellales bacterium]
MATNVQTSSKHPKGFWFVSTLQIFERFSFYGMRGILILFLTSSIASGGLGLDDKFGSEIYAWFTMLVYFAPLLGGWIADTFFGKRKTFFIGSFFITGGLFVMFASSGLSMFYVGLGLLIIGNGLWKPNITSLIGDFYDDHDPKKDGAYSMFYTFTNIGALFGPMICGFLYANLFATFENGQIVTYGYKYGFLASGISMLIGSVLYALFAEKYVGKIGTACKAADKKNNSHTKSEPLTKSDWKRVATIMGLSLFVIVFWAGFEQAGSSMTLFAQRYVDRSVGGWMIPTNWFQMINPFFCIVLGPTFALWFVKLAKRPKGDIPTTRKMAYGLMILASGFAVLMLASLRVESTGSASWLFLAGAYILHTVGEMFLSPIGLSMVNKLSPKQIAAVMMGAWYAATGFGNYLAGISAGFVESMGSLQIFGMVTVVSLAAGILLLLMGPIFQKVMDEADAELAAQRDQAV